MPAFYFTVRHHPLRPGKYLIVSPCRLDLHSGIQIGCGIWVLWVLTPVALVKRLERSGRDNLRSVMDIVIELLRSRCNCYV